MTEVLTAEAVMQTVRDRGLSHVNIGYVDLNGTMKSKISSVERLESGLDNGIGMVSLVNAVTPSGDCITSSPLWDPDTGGLGDGQVAIIADSMRDFPFTDGGKGVLVLSQFTDQNAEICPRAIMGKQVRRAKDFDITPIAGFEYECVIFNETLDTIVGKTSEQLIPWGRFPPAFDLIDQTMNDIFYKDILHTAAQMGINVDTAHTEHGAGLVEFTLLPESVSRAADNAAILKTLIKIVALRHGRIASFMARYQGADEGQGCGTHMHISLRDATTGESIGFETGKPHDMSDRFRHFLGGLQKYTPRLFLMVAPNLNSYKRFVEKQSVPLQSTWGHDNRTCAYRIIGGSPKAQRIEFRVAGADSNPYLILAVAIAAGTRGIEEQVEPTAGIDGNAWEVSLPDDLAFPTTFDKARNQFSQSEVAREVFGDNFVDHFVLTREWEKLQFDRHITDWEIREYLTEV